METTLKVTAKALNVRAKPNLQAPVLGQLAQHEVVTRSEVSPDGLWVMVQSGALRGWASAKYLLPVAGAPSLSLVTELAAASPFARVVWRDRGLARPGYVKGIALSFARAYVRYAAGDPVTLSMAQADTGKATRDALSHYRAQFAELGLSNESSGVDTLRHLFVLLAGLGMRESSGKHCCGRDTTASNSTASTAEAGMFQTSYDIRGASPLLVPLFRAYQARPEGFADVYAEGVTCSATNWANFGTGDGRDFQALSKSCPDFSAQFAALGLRHRRSHWGPVNRREVELRREADDLFKRVQQVVDTNALAPLLV